MKKIKSNPGEPLGTPQGTNVGGVQIQKIKEKPMRTNGLNHLKTYKLDWLTFTIPFDEELVAPTTKIKEILSLFNYELHEFEDTNGKFFYTSGITLGNYVNLYFNGDVNRTSINKNKLTIVFTGQGCTDLYNRLNGDIDRLFKEIKKLSANVTRIDLALDDFTGDIKLQKIEDKLVKGHYKSSLKSYSIVKSSDTNKSDLGNTIYIGSTKSSDYYLRIYDKKSQYEQKSQQLPEVAEKYWNRFEICYKKEKANEIFNELLNGTSEDRIFKTTLRKIIEILEPTKTKEGTHKNKSRWNKCLWWEKFLELNEKITFSNHERDLDLGRLLDWLTTAVVPSIKLLEELLKARGLDEKGVDIYSILERIPTPLSKSKKQNRLLNDALTLSESELLKYLSLFQRGVSISSKERN